MNIESSQRQRGAETVWLDAAYDLLTENGVESVKIMPLAKALGVSRTSFYWHFKDRETLLERMVDMWEEKNTGNLVARAAAYADSICEAMFNLFDCWLDDALFDAKLDLAIRNWARNDHDLRKRLERADSRRHDAIASMFRQFDYSEKQAEVRSLTILYTQVGYISMQIPEDRRTRLARMPEYVEVFTGKSPTQPEIERFMSRHAD